MPNKSPQISRRFSAPKFITLTNLLTASLLVLLILSINISSASTPLSATLTDLQRQPFDMSGHMNLAQIYYQMGDLAKAKKELELIDEFLLFNLKGDQVLGETTEIASLKTKIESEPQEIKRQREYWQKIVTDHPDYRDAWLQLLYQAYNAGDLTEARVYLEKIKSLDPNFVNELPDSLQSL